MTGRLSIRSPIPPPTWMLRQSNARSVASVSPLCAPWSTKRAIGERATATTFISYGISRSRNNAYASSSRAVRYQVRDHLPIAFEDLGESEVKNDLRPLRVSVSCRKAGLPPRGAPPERPALGVLPFQISAAIP